MCRTILISLRVPIVIIFATSAVAATLELRGWEIPGKQQREGTDEKVIVVEYEARHRLRNGMRMMMPNRRRTAALGISSLLYRPLETRSKSLGLVLLPPEKK